MSDFEQRLQQMAAEMDARAEAKGPKPRFDRREYGRNYYHAHKEVVMARQKEYARRKAKKLKILKAIDLLKAEGYRIEKDGQAL